jgi:hypothetical protein
MCLVLEWSTGFLATLMELVVSHMRGTWEHSSPKSLSVHEIQSSCEQQLAAATYSASVVDWATLDCLREHQETSEDPKTGKYLKSISNRLDTPQSRHPKNQEAKGKRTPNTKDQAQECIEDTWRSAWWPADVKSSVTPENELTETQKTGCPASSQSSTRGSRSCSSTSSGPRALRPHPHRAL